VDNMPTKFIKCPYCSRLTFIRYGNPRWVTCKKTLDPKFKELRKLNEITSKELISLPFKIGFRSGCYKKFMVNSNGNVILKG